MCKRKKFSYTAIGVIKLNRLLWAAMQNFRILNIINTAENRVVRQWNGVVMKSNLLVNESTLVNFPADFLCRGCTEGAIKLVIAP